MDEPTNTTHLLKDFDYTTSVDTDVAILQTSVCVICLPISLFLIYGIVLYEHQGVDSQKRSIFNQLLSAAFTTLGSLGLTVTIPITIRCWTGPLGHVIGVTISIIRRFLLVLLSLLGLDILIYKNLCLLQPNWMLRLHDNFWVTFLSIWNGIFALVITNTDWYSSSAHPAIYLFISGKGDLHTATDMWKLFGGLQTMIIVLLISYMIIRLIKTPETEPQIEEGAQMFNNMVHNPALVSNLQILMVIGIFVVVAIPGTFLIKDGPNGFILGTLPGIVAAFPVVPMLFYAFNGNMRNFVVKEVLGFIPNDVHVQHIEANSQIRRF